MLRFSCTAWVGTIAFLAAVAVADRAVAKSENGSSPTKPSSNFGRMNCGAQIECVTPDGHPGRISKLPVQDPNATALIMEDDTVTCVLKEGETNFVIELPDVAVPDRFTFLNENGKAHGELKISVSNQRLSPNSPDWKEVDGVIPFSHKRLFGVSLLGIEAKYVRLSFRVEKQPAAVASNSAQADHGLTDITSATKPVNPFSDSALDRAMNASIAPIRSAPVLASSIVSSVAPLRLASH